MAKVLVTGGAGFIGSHTANALLARGHSVRVLDVLDPQVHGSEPRFPESLPADVECLRGDVRNPDDVGRALRGVDIVFHLAARTGVGQSMYDVRDYVDVNCTGTATVLEGLAKSRRDIQRLVLSSSRAVYGEGTHRCPAHGEVHPDARPRERLEQGRFEVLCPVCSAEVMSVPTAEDRPLKPVSIYGATKKHQEELCTQVAVTYGIPLTILRYFNVYGSGQCLGNPYSGVLSIFYSQLRTRQPIALYERGEARRDFVHVSDVVAANLGAMDADVTPSTAVNIGSGAMTAIRDVVNAIGTVTGQRPEARETTQFRVGDIHACVADVRRAAELLGFVPRVDLESGIREFLRWAEGEEPRNLYQKSVSELNRYGLFGEAVSRPD
jgi:dTDP-L-rhamnose 4-epimerase